MFNSIFFECDIVCMLEGYIFRKQNKIAFDLCYLQDV